MSNALAERVATAESAFASDPSYVIAMAESSSLIRYKRRVWAIRREAKDAEECARAECEETPTAGCTNRSACGFGDCRFARGDRARVHTPARSSGRERSMPGSPYEIEDAIAELTRLRGVRR